MEASFVLTLQQLLASDEGRALVAFSARWVIYLYLPVVLFAYRSTDLRHAVIEALWSAAVALMSSTVLAGFFGRTRPYAAVEGVFALVAPNAQAGSLPSSHTAVAFAVASAIAFKNMPLGIAAFLMAFLVAFGRVASGMHYLTDVLAGALLGSGAFFLVRWGHRALRTRHSSMRFTPPPWAERALRRFPEWQTWIRSHTVIAATSGLALLLLLLFVHAAWLSQPRASSPMTVTFEEGTSRREVIRTLAEQGLVSRMWYTAYSFLDVNARHPKAGEYELRRGLSYRTIAALLAAGPVRRELTVRTWEGETIDENAERLWDAYGTSTSTYAAIVGASQNAQGFDRTLELEYPFLASVPRGHSLEGYLFPDTYRVWKDTLPEDLLYKQLDALAALIEEEAEAQAVSGLTWHEILTLASVIQKEMNGAEAQKIAAGVFFNRMAYRIPLASDATVNYATGNNKARNTYTDLETDSPYNTYKYLGLPPGPISNPGRSAILAVLYPIDTDYFYFLHDAAGNVYWAQNGVEHNANRARAFGE